MQDFGIEDKGGNDSPTSRLEVVSEAIRSKATDPILEGLGLGNYSDKEHWQQVQSFGDGMFAESAFGGVLVERIIRETVVKLGEEGYSYWDERSEELVETDGWEDLSEKKRGRKERKEWILRNGRKIWEGLSDEEKEEAIETKTGVAGSWTPPHWRIMQARHESSRSRDARLQDNFFQTREVQRLEGDENAGSWFKGGGK